MSTNNQPQLARTVGIQEDDGSFQRKNFADIERDILARAREELGDDVDLSQGSPIKQLLDVVIYEHERTWQVLEDLYYSSYYQEAYQTQLDKLLALATMDRIPRRGATGEASFSVNVANSTDVTIERGAIIHTKPTEDKPAIPFKTTQVAVLPAGESSVDGVPIRALEPWEAETDLDPDWLGSETNVAAHTITQFRTSVDGVDHVTNPNPTGDTDVSAGYDFVRGRDRETDAEFRDRYESSLGENGAATLANIRQTVANLDVVDAASIEENVTMQDNTATGGLPPKAFRVTVLPNTDTYHDEVAGAIGRESRSAGIESYGDASGQWVSSDEVTRTEWFTEATQHLVYVEASVTHDETFPDDGNKRVEDAIIRYIGGETPDGTQHEGTPLGEDVVYDLVWKAAMSVQGVWQADVFIGLQDPPTGTRTIEVDTMEVAQTSPGAISVSPIRQDRP